MIRVLFVCEGNICRSPMAEAVFQHLVDEARLSDKILTDSAGTSSWHVGERADHRTLKELDRHGISYNGRSRRLDRGDFEQFDYILAMDHKNLGNIRSMAPREADVHTSLFLEFAPDLNVQVVPDPYYEGGFDQIYKLIRPAAEGLLAHIRRDHGL